jgi:ferrous iron transport protein A
MSELMSLNDIKPGEKCVIKKIVLSGAEGQRLMDMGFVRGVELEVRRNAPFADPFEVLINGYYINLRHMEAELVKVEKI